MCPLAHTARRDRRCWQRPHARCMHNKEQGRALTRAADQEDVKGAGVVHASHIVGHQVDNLVDARGAGCGGNSHVQARGAGMALVTA